MTAKALFYLAESIVALAMALMPRDLRHWGGAMRAEVRILRPPHAALAFAFGCLGVALQLSLLSRPTHGSSVNIMPLFHDLSRRPRAVAALCAVSATGLGLAYMTLAGAPVSYLAMNTAALVAGLLAMGIIAQLTPIVRPPIGWITIAVSAALMLVALCGTSVEGATRWIALGPLTVQPSLIVVPVLSALFARDRGAASTVGIAIAAAALAMQPDRAMSGALMAGMLTLFILRREPMVALALCTTAAGFVTAMIRPDTQAAMPWVDQILFSAFDVHPLAGGAVLTGSALLVVPAIIGARGGKWSEPCVVFGAVWLAAIIAAAMGNYPTPLVGYGGSAIVGYLIALTALPRRSDSQEISDGRQANGPKLPLDTMMRLAPVARV